MHRVRAAADIPPTMLSNPFASANLDVCANICLLNVHVAGVFSTISGGKFSH